MSTPERPLVPADNVTVPRRLTAENGAKFALAGEFTLRHEARCSGCCFDEADPDCEVCGGEINYIEPIAIDWTTIKEIYAKSIDLFATEGLPKTHSAKTDAGEEPSQRHDLKTSAGGRSYLADLFRNDLKRHDFNSYIQERLAADFACVLSQWIEERRPASQEDKWHKCIDQMPAQGQRVLMFATEVIQGRYFLHEPGLHEGDSGFCDLNGDEVFPVTHWQPEPRGPRSKGDL